MSAVNFAQSVNTLGHIDDINHRLPEDDAVFAEVREVLKRHGAETKYGLTLLHKHFDLKADEVLVEYTDVTSRTQLTKPVRIDDIADKNLIETMWRLDDEHVMRGCSRFCFPTYESDGAPKHDRYHERT
ncbi:MAG TPA: hypothetical protein VFZ16_00615 [Hyphomicrobiaceae bacterium]|nr:hypothetical protein [Hyphomicrobiaceae bacterium]